MNVKGKQYSDLNIYDLLIILSGCLIIGSFVITNKAELVTYMIGIILYYITVRVVIVFGNALLSELGFVDIRGLKILESRNAGSLKNNAVSERVTVDDPTRLIYMREIKDDNINGLIQVIAVRNKVGGLFYRCVLYDYTNDESALSVVIVNTAGGIVNQLEDERKLPDFKTSHMLADKNKFYISTGRLTAIILFSNLNYSNNLLDNFTLTTTVRTL